jgi:hypothetical protein
MPAARRIFTCMEQNRKRRSTVQPAWSNWPDYAHIGFWMSRAWIRSRLWLAPWLLIVSILGYPWLHTLVLGVEITPAEHGYRVAVRAGCFNCHGPNGTGGVKNPGPGRLSARRLRTDRSIR